MRKITWLMALAVPTTFMACQKEGVQDQSSASVTLDHGANVQTTGNGSLSGSHYTLNIHGVPKGKTADMKNSDGRSIFVWLDGNSKIYLTPGNFQVLDANGTDNDGATFQLPYPDNETPTTDGPDGDYTTSYSVFARALGKPGGEMTIRNCATDPSTNQVVCEDWADTENVLTLKRSTGKSSFQNVTKQLLYIYVDITDDGVYNPVLYPIFDNDMEDYYWELENNRLRLAQLRFYPVPTTVTP